MSGQKGSLKLNLLVLMSFQILSNGDLFWFSLLLWNINNYYLMPKHAFTYILNI